MIEFTSYQAGILFGVFVGAGITCLVWSLAFAYVELRRRRAASIHRWFDERRTR